MKNVKNIISFFQSPKALLILFWIFLLSLIKNVLYTKYLLQLVGGPFLHNFLGNVLLITHVYSSSFPIWPKVKYISRVLAVPYGNQRSIVTTKIKKILSSLNPVYHMLWVIQKKIYVELISPNIHLQKNRSFSPENCLYCQYIMSY